MGVGRLVHLTVAICEFSVLQHIDTVVYWSAKAADLPDSAIAVYLTVVQCTGYTAMRALPDFVLIPSLLIRYLQEALPLCIHGQSNTGMGNLCSHIWGADGWPIKVSVWVLRMVPNHDRIC